VAAAGSRDYATAFGKLLADPLRGHLEWTPAEQDAYREAAQVRSDLERSLVAGTNANGGFMVPTHLDPAIMLSGSGTLSA
jgi:predicted phage gp36 major capsid-like protein